MFLILSLTLHVRLSRGRVFFCQSLTEVNIAVQQRSGSQVVHAHRWWSERCVDFRKWFQPSDQKTQNRRKRGSLWTWINGCEKARRGDKQRSSRSRHGATVLHARRPPHDVRMSRVLSIPEACIKSSNPFVLEPYRKRLKRCAGCMSELLHDPPTFVVSKREWYTYFYAGRQCLSWRKMFYHYSTSCIIRRHPDFNIANVVINPEQ